MVDEVAMVHRHDDGERQMRHLDDERIDGLRLREFTCDCGYSVAVLTRVQEEQQGKSWPFAFRSSTAVS